MTRNEFKTFDSNALKISEVHEYKTTVSRKRKLRADESRDVAVQLSGGNHFRVNSFNVILDNIYSELRKRCLFYERIKILSQH